MKRATTPVTEYYRSTENSAVRPELKHAFSRLQGGGTAIDCGCGAGSNIAHLRAQGYAVHAFDINEQAISLCTQRFKDDSNVFLSVASFGDFDYPSASLVLADASLFFCPQDELGVFLDKIYQSLEPDGVFCGAFLGVRDTMTQPEFDSRAYWGDVLAMSEAQVRKALFNFDILQLTEHELDGVTPAGDDHHWHILTVVARAN